MIEGADWLGVRVGGWIKRGVSVRARSVGVEVAITLVGRIVSAGRSDGLVQDTNPTPKIKHTSKSRQKTSVFIVSV